MRGSGPVRRHLYRAAAALAVAGLVAVLPSSVAAASTVTVVTPVLSTLAAAATGVTYSVSFATSSAGALSGGSGTITLSAASGTSFPSSRCAYTIDDTTTNSATSASDCPTNLDVTGGGDQVTLTLPSGYAIEAGDAVTLTADGVTNPSAGSDTLQVSTSADSSPASSSGLTIAAPRAVANATASLSSLVGDASDVTYTFGMDSSPNGGLVGGQGTMTLSAPSGTTFPSSACQYEVDDVTSGKSGDCVGSLQVGSGGNTATFTLPAAVSTAGGDNLNVVVSGVTNPSAGSVQYEVSDSSDSVTATTESVALSGDPGTTSSVTDVTGDLSSTAEGATGTTDIITFVASSNGGLPNGGAVTLVAPVGTVFDAGGQCDTVDDVTTGQNSGGCNSASFAGDGSIMTLQSGVAINPGDSVSVTAENVSNPQLPSTTFSVSTVSDGVFAQSPAITLASPQGVSNLTVSPSTSAEGAHEVTETIAFDASANGALAQSFGTVTIEGATGTAFPGGGNCNYSVTDVTTGATQCANVDSLGGASRSSLVQVSMPGNLSVAAGDQVQLKISSVVDPVASSLEPSVSTSSDTVPVSASAPLSAARSVTLATPSLTLSSTAAGASGVTMTLEFTTSSLGSLAAGSGTITLSGTYPTTFPGNNCDYQFDDVTTQFTSGCAAGVSDGASTATVTVPQLAIRGGDEVELTVTNVENPGSGSLAVTMSTSSDTVAVTTPTVTMAAPSSVSLSSASVAPAVRAAGGVTSSLTFKVSAEGALEGGSGTIEVQGEPGTGLPGSGNCGYQIADVTTSTSSGCVNGVRVGAGGSIADVPLPGGFTINAGNTVSLTITGGSNPPGAAQAITVWTSSDVARTTSSTIALSAGTSVTNPALEVSTPVAGAADITDTATFDTTTAIGSTSAPNDGNIELKASPGTVFPGDGCDYTLTDVTTSTSQQCIAVSHPSPSTVDLSMPQFLLKAGDEVSVSITGVANATGASEALSIATSSDPVPAAAPAVTLASPVAPASASASLSSSAAGTTGVTDTIDLTASAQGSVLANASSGVLVVGVPGSSFSGNGCDYTWTDITTSDSQNCVGVAQWNNVLVLSPPFPVHPGDKIEIQARNAANPTTTAQRFQVKTASDSVFAVTPDIPLTGGTAATADTAATLTLGSTAKGATATAATIAWTETAAAASGDPVTVEAGGGMAFTDGNTCDYTVTDVTSGTSWQLCQDNSGASLDGPRGDVITFDMAGLSSAAGDQLEISVPDVENAAGSGETVSIATGADPTFVTSSPASLTAAQSVSGAGLAVSDPIGGRADTTWTITFTASSTGALSPNDAIVIDVPPGTGLPSDSCAVTLTDLSTEHSANCVNLSDSGLGDELSISTQNFPIRAGDQVQVTLPGMTNPAASSVAATVRTTTDTVSAATAPVSLASGSSVASPSVSLSTSAAGAGSVTGTFGFTTSSSGALDGGNDLVSIVGSPGVAFPGNNCWYMVSDLTNGHSASCVGNLDVGSDGQVVSFSPPGGLDIGAGDQVDVVISGVNNPPSGVSGSPGTASFDLWTTADSVPVTVSESLTAPAAPSNVSADVSDPVSGAGQVSVTATFTASSQGTLGQQGWIELEGAAGTQWPGSTCDYTITDLTTQHSSSCVSGVQITGDGSTVLVTTNEAFTINAGDSVEVEVAGAANPFKASDAIEVATSSEPVPASSAVALSAANPVSTPTLTVSSPAAGAADVTYTVAFATSATGQLANGEGAIELLAAPGTRLPGNNCDYTVTDTTNTHSVSCVDNLGVYGSQAEATFVVPPGFSIEAGDDLVVQVAGVTNPPSGTSGSVAVATSSDITPAASNAVSYVAASAPGKGSLQTSSGALGQSGVTYSVAFTASTSGSLPSGSGTITLVAGPGTAFGNGGGSWCATVDDTTTDRSSSCDPAAISADGSAVTVTTNTSVNAGDAVVVTLSGVTNPPVTSTEPAELWTSSDLVPTALTAPNLSGDAIAGTVETTTSGSTSAVSGVLVEACPTGGSSCVSGGTTGTSGQFSIAVPAGTYELQATPPPAGGAGSSSALQAAAYGPVTASSGSSATGIVINMAPEAAIPSGSSVNGQTSGVPTIFWGSASTVTVTGCPGGMAEAVLQGTDEQSGTTIVRDVPLTETPPDSGSYTGTVPPLYPVHGNVTVAPFIYCAPLAAVLPYAGPTAGGTRVTIFGHGFTGATAVHFGSSAATDVTVVSDSEVTAVSPAGTGQVPVTVTTPSGTTPASSLASFTYLSISGVSPATGNVSGGGTVLVTGTGFTTAQQVFFGATRSIFNVINDHEIIAYVPPASSAGTVDVTVETSGGTSVTSTADQFSYSSTAPTPSTPQQIPTPPPTGTPPSCASSGAPGFCSAPPAQSITNAPPLSQGFGGSMPDPSAILSSLSSSATYAVTQGDSPPDNSGDWTSLLQWNGSTDWIGNSLSIGDNLTSLMNGDVFASDIAEEEDFEGGFGSLSDSLAELMADSSLEDSFLDFALGPVGGIALAAFSMWCSSADPSGILGGACAVASVPTDIMDFALSTSLNLLQKLWNMYIDPSGTVVDDKGNPISGATVTILGSSSGGSAGPYQAIPSGSVVTQPSTNPETSTAEGQFGWDVVPGWYEIEASKAGCHAPGSPTVDDVVTPAFDVPPPQDGLQLVLTCQSEPAPAPPTVTGLSSSSGPASGGTTISIAGSGFVPSSTVDFGSTAAASVTFVSSTTLEAVAPSGSGTVDVTVSGPGGTSATGTPDEFTYISAPTVSGLSSHAGSSAGGSLIEIDGSGFEHATSVLFGGAAAISFFVQSDSEIEATAPPGSGTVDVTVTSPDGPSSTSAADRFTYASALVVTTSKLEKATVGDTYSIQLQASGGVAPYRWALTSGQLPPGLSFSSKGLLSGVPTKAAAYSFGVQLSDSDTPADTVATELTLTVVPNTGPGYWVVTVKGKVSGFGSALSYAAQRPSGTVVGIASLAPPSGSTVSQGYFVATATGKVYGYGKAKVVGHPTVLKSPVVAIAAAPKGDGYLLATAAGAVYAYGTEHAHGGLAKAPKSPITAIAAAPSGGGYWLLSANGTVYPFGSVKSYGSAAHFSGQAVAIVPDVKGTGYWIATSAGAVDHFGSAGSYGGERRAPSSPVVGMTAGPHGAGYWLVSANGKVYGFGSAKVIGSVSRPASKVAGIAAA